MYIKNSCDVSGIEKAPNISVVAISVYLGYFPLCSVFTVVCRKRLFSPRCRSELIDSAWVVIVPGQKNA